MSRIFICYRRDDAGYVALMLCGRLRKVFGPDSVFIDVDTIPIGFDFRQYLDTAVSKCDYFLAIIGDFWLAPTDHTTKYIDDPSDFVRIEIEAALRRDIPIVPVLVGRARMPKENDLPESLRPLVFRNAAEIRHGRDMEHQIESLIRGLQAHFEHIPTSSQPATVTQGHEAIRPVRQAHRTRDKQSTNRLLDANKTQDGLIGDWHG
jgi:TIR domain